MEVGATCYCLGEAQDIFTVSVVLDRAAVLLDADGYGHGTESFTKLYKTMGEWEKRVHPERVGTDSSAIKYGEPPWIKL
jgi:hypothetical protein